MAFGGKLQVAMGEIDVSELNPVFYLDFDILNCCRFLTISGRHQTSQSMMPCATSTAWHQMH